MNYENSSLITKQHIIGPPVSLVQSGRKTYTSVTEDQAVSTDPPGVPVSGSVTENRRNRPFSVQLVDETERILFDDCESLASQLNCPMDRPVKVVAAVGNTGDGKSHTMNHTFFNGEEVFVTSSKQTNCTIGVWAAYSASSNCVVLDTEGMLGTSLNHNQHRRLLLKVFAVSDVVIYVTKAPRLHSDMFTFLADASDSFAQHFRPDLEALAKKTGLPWTPGQLGPAVIVFQETRHTDPLDAVFKPSDFDLTEIDASGSISQLLQNRLRGLKRNVDSFCSLNYVGTQTKEGPTDFKSLRVLTTAILKDTSVRIPRNLEHIFSGLHLLNMRFTNDIPPNGQYTFVEEYFTCPVTCKSCSVRCSLGTGHLDSHQPSSSGHPRAAGQSAVGCKYDPLLKNKLYFCKDCYAMGIETLVVPKTGDSLFDAARYLLSGYVLECKRHGIIYQSRSLWAANAEPEETARVHWKVIHVWTGEDSILQGIHPFSQILLDGVSAVTKQMSGIAGPSVRQLGDLFTDSLAPDYWQPNSAIRQCYICKFEFPDPSIDGIDYDLRAKISLSVEGAGERCGDLRSHGVMKEPHSSARTVPRNAGHVSDGDPSTRISTITKKLVMDTDKHHCRSCGQGVCSACSTGSLPIPGFGSHPVRVCDRCYSERSTQNARPVKSIEVSCPEISPDKNENSNVYTGRKALELCSATISSVPPVFDVFKDTFKNLARPDYWTPDHLCIRCAICEKIFGPFRRIHHCRSCGRGVCEPCSPHRQPVPLRGLDLPHRVCNGCFRLSQ